MIRRATRFGTKYCCGFWQKKNKETANIDGVADACTGRPVARHVRGTEYGPAFIPLCGAVLWSPRKLAPDHLEVVSAMLAADHSEVGSGV